MQKQGYRPLYRPVMRCLVRQSFVYLDTLYAIVGADPADVLLISGLGWLTGADTTFPSPGETEDQAEQLLAIRRPEPVESLAVRVALTEDGTVRRLADLERRGLVQKTPEGYLAAHALLHGPAMERVRREVFVGVASFLDDLAALGVHLPEGQVSAHETRRRVSRLTMRFFLDGGIPDLMRQLGWSPEKAVTFLGVCDANYDAVRASPELSAQLARSQGLLPDDIRHPVTRTALAKRLGFPRAATARIADELLAEGWLQARGRGGLIAPGHVLIGDDVGAVAQRAWDATVAFVQSVHRVGMPMPRPAWGRRSGGIHNIPGAA